MEAPNPPPHRLHPLRPRSITLAERSTSLFNLSYLFYFIFFEICFWPSILWKRGGKWWMIYCWLLGGISKHSVLFAYISLWKSQNIIYNLLWKNKYSDSCQIYIENSRNNSRICKIKIFVIYSQSTSIYLSLRAIFSFRQSVFILNKVFLFRHSLKSLGVGLRKSLWPDGKLFYVQLSINTHIHRIML